jgi:uracil-DNA glycosylase family 4
MPYVPAEGPRPARLMIVGESPGREEESEGRPFIGQAGQLLDRAIEVSPLRREEIFITNAVKVKPRGDKSKFFFEGGAPTPAYLGGIIELGQEIQEVQPNIILAFGNYALWALTQETGVFEKRGSPIRAKLGQAWVIPSIHPAWYLRSRQWQKSPILEWDVRKAARLSVEPFSPPEREYILEPSEQELMTALERFRRAETLSIDTEWYSPEHLAYMGITDSPDFAIVVEPYDDFRKTILQEMLRLPVPKVMQNAMFDVVALARLGFDVANMADDTMVAWHWCWPRLGEKSLNFISSVMTDEPYYKGDIEFVGQGDKRGKAYCCTDTTVTLEAMQAIREREFPATRGGRGYEISMKMMDPFLEASKLGILVDQERLAQLEQQHLEKADQIEAALAETLGHPINCRSGPQVCKVVYDEIGIPGRTKRTSAQDVLMDIAASETREDVKAVLTAIIRVRQNRNIVSRYLHSGIVDHDGRARANWNLANTLSGRLSTTKPWWPGVSLQTVPIDAREIYIPDPRHIFVGWDLEQAEARYVAAETRDYDLLDAMEAGKDIHSLLAPMLGLTYEHVLGLVAEATAAGKSKDEVEERFLLKTCRHSMNYVQSWMGLKMRVNKQYLETGIGITAAKAKELEAGYLDLNPGLEAWWDEIYRQIKNRGYLENSFHRRVAFYEPVRKRDHIHRSAVSFKPQSSIGDLTSLSIARVWERARWMQILLHGHDGGIYQVPEDRVEEAQEIIRTEMTQPIRAGRMAITVPVETKVGRNWKEMG